MRNMEFIVENQTVLIDKEDAHFIHMRNWKAFKKPNGYYIKSSKTAKDRSVKVLWLHRLIMGVNDLNWKDSIVDHINGNTLDNRRSNLRIVTTSQNNVNSKVFKNNKTGFKGVDFKKSENKFRARISVNCTRIELGLFNTPQQAAIAYNNAAIKYYGDHAKLNIIR